MFRHFAAHSGGQKEALASAPQQWWAGEVTFLRGILGVSNPRGRRKERKNEEIALRPRTSPWLCTVRGRRSIQDKTFLGKIS